MATTAAPAPPPTAGALDLVRDLTPAVAARTASISAARRVPPDLLAALTAAGCFRLLLPHNHGGGGGDLPGAMRVYEALSRADASVGWTAMIGASAWCDLAGLPRATLDALYAAGPDVIVDGGEREVGEGRSRRGEAGCGRGVGRGAITRRR
jgi:alkylation response protein AidB-like acyl-CoA dehydrogenase